MPARWFSDSTRRLSRQPSNTAAISASVRSVRGLASFSKTSKSSLMRASVVPAEYPACAVCTAESNVECSAQARSTTIIR